jgi:Ca2+:H+ antiporter
MRHWPVFIPFLALALLGAGLAMPANTALLVACAPLLMAAVIAAVHHAEVIAHKVGEPFGTLILALAVTVIEAALILSTMIAGGAATATLPRDTIFAAVMIICHGVLGLCILVGALRYHEQDFRVDGVSAGMASLVALATLSLVLPSFTTSSSEGTYTTSQLAFVGVMSLVLWLVFVFMQTVRHRDYFLPKQHVEDETLHAEPPTTGQTWASVALLLVALVSVVGLAKLLSPTIESALAAASAPKAVLGIIIAGIVLLPETWAAVRAAYAHRLQTSMNLALGSALASIGLTIPTVVVASVWLDLPLRLGLEAKDLTLLALTFIVGTLTLASGRTNLMQGAVHLVIFAAFVFLALVP